MSLGRKINASEWVTGFCVCLIFVLIAASLYKHYAEPLKYQGTIPITIIPYNTPDEHTTLFNHDMQQAKAYVDKKLPNLPLVDTYHKATMLRDFVQRSIPIDRDERQSLGQKSFTYEALIGFLEGNHGLICGGLSYVYMSLLELYGIPFRNVGLKQSYLLRELGGVDDSHATVEILINGHWMLSDPTFNNHWELNGKALNTVELAEAFELGAAPIAKTDHYQVPRSRQVAHYQIPFQTLLTEIVTTNYYPWRVKRTDICCSKLAYRSHVGIPLYVFDFSQGLPPSWRVPAPDTTTVNPLKQIISFDQIVPVSLTSIKKFEKPFEYALITTESLPMPAGLYEVVVKANIDKGGIGIGILDESQPKWIAQTLTTEQSTPPGRPIRLQFKLSVFGRYHVVLFNNNLLPGNESEWSISEVSVIGLWDYKRLDRLCH